MLVLGFGINAYFKMIKAAFILMLVCMLANLPLIFIYSSYDAYHDMPIAQASLGNLGGSLSVCQ